MSLITSILTALFMMCVVFLVLILLWVVLRVLGAIFTSMEKSKNQTLSQNGIKPEQNS